MSDAIDYLAIGHVAKDLTPDGWRLGGTVAYAALTVRAFGYTPGVVTSYGDDMDLSPVSAISVSRVASPTTTTFENIYGPKGRTQYLHARAAPLDYAAVPTSWRRAPVVHLAPLAREVDTGLARSFAATGALVGLTLQGWLREWDDDGRVRARETWPEAGAVLPHAGAVVFSLEDVRGDWDLARSWAETTAVLVVTQGPRGCTVFARREAPRVFPAPAQAEVDPTGAGDIFAAAFFVTLHQTGDPWVSAQLANEVAARSITRTGLEGVPTAEEVSMSQRRLLP